MKRLHRWLKPTASISVTETDPYLTLHIGAHRTGTASFQRYLEEAVATSEAPTFLPFTPPNTRAPNHFRGLQKLASNLDNFIRGSEKERLSLRRQVIISDENIIGSIGNNIQEKMPYRKALRRLRIISTTIPKNSTIAVTVRRYDEWWQSQILYYSRRLDLPAILERDVRSIASSRRGWKELVEDVQEVFSTHKVVVIGFEDYVGSHDFLLRALCPSLRDQALPKIQKWVNRTPDHLHERGLDRLQGIHSERLNYFLETGHIFYEEERSYMLSRYEADKSSKLLSNLNPL